MACETHIRLYLPPSNFLLTLAKMFLPDCAITALTTSLDYLLSLDEKKFDRNFAITALTTSLDYALSL